MSSYELKIDNNIGLLSKASPCVELAIGTMWRHSTDVNKNAGNNTSWACNVSCNITSTQLRRDHIKVKVIDSGKVVGEGSVTALPLFVKPGAVIQLKCDLINSGQPAGAVILTARFLSNGDKEKSKIIAGDMVPPAVASTQSDKEKQSLNAVVIIIIIIQI